jgi:tetratricopeptide (TPR) repeat protein
MRFFSCIVAVLITFSLYAADGPMDAGEKYYLKGQYSSAVASYKKALEYDLNENNRAQCWYMIGQSYLMLGNMTQARAAFNMIRSQYVKTEWLAPAYVGIGDTYYRERQYTSALKSYENSMSKSYLGKHGSSVYYRLARTHRALKDTSKANYYENVIRSQYPDSLEARLLLSGRSSTGSSSATKTGSSSSSKKYTVQISYTTRADYAQEYASKFKKKGYDAYVRTTSYKGKTRYKVLVGEFSGREAAEKLLKKLKQNEKVEGFVTSL